MNNFKNILTIIVLELFSCNLFCQTFTLHTSIGNFNNARSFSVNKSGFIFIADNYNNEIIKIDTMGTVVKTVGGFGIGQSQFDDPFDLLANTLNVYVADKNNDRIQIFDKDLNFLSTLKAANDNSNNAFRYPTSVSVSNQGDIYVLDSDNKRVLKFNMRGEFLLSIGGNDAGLFQLSNPIKLCLDNYNNLLVLQNNIIFVFDQFGNGLLKINVPFFATNINSFGDSIILVNERTLMSFKVPSKNLYEIDIKPTQFSFDDEIVDATFFNQKLYILTKHSINIFTR